MQGDGGSMAATSSDDGLAITDGMRWKTAGKKMRHGTRRTAQSGDLEVEVAGG